MCRYAGMYVYVYEYVCVRCPLTLIDFVFYQPGRSGRFSYTLFLYTVVYSIQRLPFLSFNAHLARYIVSTNIQHPSKHAIRLFEVTTQTCSFFFREAQLPTKESCVYISIHDSVLRISYRRMLESPTTEPCPFLHHLFFLAQVEKNKGKYSIIYLYVRFKRYDLKKKTRKCINGKQK